jgi:hypothetical protein
MSLPYYTPSRQSSFGVCNFFPLHRPLQHNRLNSQSDILADNA